MVGVNEHLNKPEAQALSLAQLDLAALRERRTDKILELLASQLSMAREFFSVGSSLPTELETIGFRSNGAIRERFTTRGLSSNTITIAETRSYFSCESGSVTNDLYDSDSSTSLVGFHINTKYGTMLLKLNLILEWDKTRGWNTEGETKFRMNSSHFFSPNVLKHYQSNNNLHMLSNEIKEIVFIPIGTSNVESDSFSLTDLSNEGARSIIDKSFEWLSDIWQKIQEKIDSQDEAKRLQEAKKSAQLELARLSTEQHHVANDTESIESLVRKMKAPFD